MIVRDGHLQDELYVTETDGTRLKRKWTDSSVRTDLPFSEAKTEVTIDRITSAAQPRQLERVPAGALFDYSFVFDLYDEVDKDHLKLLFQGMDLLEGDYLGGYGSRGSGQIRFDTFEVRWKSKGMYREGGEATPLQGLSDSLADVIKNYHAQIKSKLQ